MFVREALLGRLRQASFAGEPGPLGALGYAGPRLAYGQAGDAYAADLGFPVKAAPARTALTPDWTWWTQAIGSWGRDRRQRQCRRGAARPGGRLHRRRPPVRRQLARGHCQRLQLFERQRQCALEFGAHRYGLCRGLCGCELRSVQFPLGRDRRLEHGQHRPFDRVSRLRRCGHGALRRGHRSGVRGGPPTRKRSATWRSSRSPGLPGCI